MSTGIPEHVAAYAAGLRAASSIRGRALSWPKIARLVERMGLGAFHPYGLELMATAWSNRHVHPGTVTSLRRSRRR